MAPLGLGQVRIQKKLQSIARLGKILPSISSLFFSGFVVYQPSFILDQSRIAALHIG
jgi:hypothetical protein